MYKIFFSKNYDILFSGLKIIPGLLVSLPPIPPPGLMTLPPGASSGLRFRRACCFLAVKVNKTK